MRVCRRRSSASSFCIQAHPERTGEWANPAPEGRAKRLYARHSAGSRRKWKYLRLKTSAHSLGSNVRGTWGGGVVGGGRAYYHQVRWGWWEEKP